MSSTWISPTVIIWPKRWPSSQAQTLSIWHILTSLLQKKLPRYEEILWSDFITFCSNQKQVIKWNCEVHIHLWQQWYIMRANAPLKAASGLCGYEFISLWFSCPATNNLLCTSVEFCVAPSAGGIFHHSQDVNVELLLIGLSLWSNRFTITILWQYMK